MHLFVDISSHGLGHLAMTAPALNALAEARPDLRLTLRSLVAPAKLKERIRPPFDLIAEASDFGFVMIDATRIDRAASAAAYREAHAGWSGRVEAEAARLADWRPDLVLSNVSYLPLAGAARAGIPACALCSLNWADLFAHYFGHAGWAAPIHADMLAAYRSAAVFLRATPGMAMNALDNLTPVDPIAALGQRRDLGLGGRRAVLVAMGGIAHRLPVEDWPRLPGICWLVPAEWNCRHPDAIAIESFGLCFTDLLCSADAIITKPGYGSFTEAAANGAPTLYQRRDDWPEQECLIAWLHEHGRCREIEAKALQDGELEAALADLWALPKRPPRAFDGAAQAAALLLKTASRSA